MLSQVMYYQVYWLLVRREPDYPEELLAVIDIDVPGQGQAEEAQRLLPVYQGHHVGAPFLSQARQGVRPRPDNNVLLEPGVDQ